MRIASRKMRAVSAVLALGLVVAACGGSDEPAAPTPDPTPAPPSEEVPSDSIAPELDPNAFYAGKEIEIIAPFAAGGGTDTQARFFAPLLEQYMAGKPRVAPFNIAGAGGVIGSNQFATQRNHEAATSVLFSSGSSFFPWLFGDPALRLNYNDLVGTAAVQTGGVIYVNASTGVTSPEEFAEAVKNGTVDWVAGEQTVDSLGLLKILAYDMLEMDAQIVLGFQGRGPIRNALETGELNINWDTTASMLRIVSQLEEAGDVVPVFTVGQVENGQLVRDPVFPDLPHLGEMYEMVHGSAPTGLAIDAYISLTLAGYTLQKVMWLHQDAPDQAVKELRDGFENMINDPVFQERAVDILGDYNIVVGDDVDGAVATLIDFPDERRNWLLDFMVDNYDYTDPR